MKRNQERTLRERLEGLTAFLPRLVEPGFSFGVWAGRKESDPGVQTLPFFTLSDTASEFVQAAYDLDWVRGDFDWGRWKDTPEAIRLRDDPQAMAIATPMQLSHLLTVLIRQERFCEGSLAAAFESGLLTAICRRAAELADQEGKGKQ